MTAPNGAQEITLSITLAHDGSVRVNGPISDKMVSYALLEMARDAIRDFNKPKIETASTADVLALSGPRRVQ
jgi:hypothetical protein